jgi:hypothetical protein
MTEITAIAYQVAEQRDAKLRPPLRVRRFRHPTPQRETVADCERACALPAAASEQPMLRRGRNRPPTGKPDPRHSADADLPYFVGRRLDEPACPDSIAQTDGVCPTSEQIGTRRPSVRHTSVSPVTHSRRSESCGR